MRRSDIGGKSPVATARVGGPRCCHSSGTQGAKPNPDIPIKPLPLGANLLKLAPMGDTLRGQVYDLTNTTVPIVDYGATDPLYDPAASDHVSGMTGVIIANNDASADGPANATFDNFVATDGQLLSANFPLLSVH